MAIRGYQVGDTYTDPATGMKYRAAKRNGRYLWVAEDGNVFSPTSATDVQAAQVVPGGPAAGGVGVPSIGGMEFPEFPSRKMPTGIPPNSNLAANLKFGAGGGGYTSAAPNALGSVKGPSALAMSRAAPASTFGPSAVGTTAGISNAALSMAIPAAMMAFGMMSRSKSDRERQATLNRYGAATKTGKTTKAGQAEITQGQGDYGYVMNPNNAARHGRPQSILREVGGPTLDDLFGGANVNLKQGARGNRGAVYETRGSKPEDLARFSQEQLDPYNAWIESMPRFGQSDQQVEDARRWVQENPFDRFRESFLQQAPQAATRPQQAAPGGRSTTSRGVVQDYDGWRAARPQFAHLGLDGYNIYRKNMGAAPIQRTQAPAGAGKATPLTMPFGAGVIQRNQKQIAKIAGGTGKQLPAAKTLGQAAMQVYASNPTVRRNKNGQQ